ncbi:AMP-binding protein [Bacillus sp. CGMCC 1.16541]|uniref:AMP-binding protein n=1 Tax=Bacillus sp. CGMCC 1.16541 TaxID=2185143 RepID=UPI000D7260AB|nr:AMP-binding protein [Bacillus sp. CGMCC 1.16541]
MIIGQTLTIHKKNRSHHPAIVTEHQVISYAELYDRIHDIQRNLVFRFGTGKQRKIGIALGNSSSFIELFFAVTTLGWVAIPFDPKWSHRERELVEEECQVDLIVDNIEPIKDQEKGEFIQWTTEDETLFYIGYTSGSTGKPKGFMRHHRSWVSSFQSVEEAFNLTMNDVFYVPGPLCHSLSLFAAVHAIHMGATLYLTSTFEPKRVASLLEDKPITTMYVVPTMIQALVTLFREHDKQLKKPLTLISSGAKCSPELKDRVKKQWPSTNLIEFYGASELSFMTYLTSEEGEKKPNSVGKPFPRVELYLLDENQQEVTTKQAGTLYVRSPFVFKGYVNEPLATKEVFRGEFATVGDVAYRDEEGFITLVGREKNMIISGGLNIYPEEVEEVIKRIEEIDEVVVTSERDVYWGEKVVALIKWKEGQSLSIDVLKNHCRNELSSFKCPKAFIEVTELPYTSSGKIARKEVQKQIRGEKV